MAHESDDWRPDVHVPRDYPPPTAYTNRPPPDVECSLRNIEAAIDRHNRGEPFDPRDALHRCLADVEAAAQRLRALLARLG